MNLSLKEYFEKFAAKKKNDFDFKTWEANLDETAKKERDLIRSFQENNDFRALKKLTTAYQGTIQNAVQKSNLTSVMSHDTAHQEGLKAFKTLVTNYDLSQPNRPGTYFIGTLYRSLNKVRHNNKDFGVRKSEELAMKSEPIAVAQSFLKSEGIDNPTAEQTLKYIKKNFKTGTSVTEANINRIDSYKRKELSGSQYIGGTESSAGAEKLTLSDIKNVNKETPEEIYDKQIKEKQITDMIAKMNKNERRLLMEMYGLGKFKNMPPSNPYRAATNSGMTPYEARKILEDFRKKIEEKGLI